MIDESAIRLRFEALAPVLDERALRRFAAAEAQAAGRGGVAVVSQITGLARSTIGRGLNELRAGEACDIDRVRRPGGGRKPLAATDPGLVDDLRGLVEPDARGDPQSPLLWTCKSLRKLSQSLCDMGHKIGRTLVGELLHGIGYSLQANRKTREGADHPDRDAQFRYINSRVKEALASSEPAISVDTKKKELVGDFKNAGREWREKGSPEDVRVHDFVIPELGRAVPYGVYDIADDAGWVSVGVDHDTGAFAVNAIRSWWTQMGRARYPNAKSLLITADGGGSNGSRLRLWKVELQKLADELGFAITVCHLPPGTSKWNRIEHRLFSFITMNWRGKPLVTHQTIVQLIAATTTRTGLEVRCELDPNAYPDGVKISDQEFNALNITRHDFHGDWNYTIAPTTPSFEAIISGQTLTLVEREGKARSFHVETATKDEIIPIVRQNVARESHVMTDEANRYAKLGNDFAKHNAVDHSRGEYGYRDRETGEKINTNTVEGYYSIFKRGMIGIYQHCGEQHLHRYLAEFDFRYSNRAKLGYDDAARARQALLGVKGKRLTYETTAAR